MNGLLFKNVEFDIRGKIVLLVVPEGKENCC